MAHSSRSDTIDGNRRHRVASLAKRLESAIVFPQVFQRLPLTSDSEATFVDSSLVDDGSKDSIITSALPNVTSRHPKQELTEASALTPRRFGSVEEGEKSNSEYSDDGSWGSEFLESGTDSWSIENVDSNSDESISDREFLKPPPTRRHADTVDAQMSLDLQLDPHTPDPVSDTVISLGNHALRRASDIPGSLEDFVDVVWNADKHPPPVLPPPPPGLSTAQKKRRCIFENLITTENSYVNTLEHLVEDYDGQLAKMGSSILSKDDRRSIFYMLRHLLQIHRTFQISLHHAASRWDEEESIALVFTACFSRVTVRRVYTAYINNYDDAMERVKQLEASNKNFSNFLAKVHRQSNFRLSLSGLMVKPIQRFPQFILLLQDLQKNTEEAHPQSFHLQRALSDLQYLANFLNERKREAQQRTEARNLMRDLHLQFVDLSKDEKRRLKLLEIVPVEYENYSSNGTLLSRSQQKLALFNIMVLCFTEAPGEKTKMQWSSPLSSVKVQTRIITPDMKVNIQKDCTGSTVIQNRSRASSAVDGQVRRRYEELQALVHDHAVLMQVSGLATTLQRRYRGFNELRLEALCTQLQRLIRQKEDENRLTDSSLLELEVTSPSKAPDGPESRRYLFDLNSPATRNAWVDRFMRQKLSEEEWNLPAWIARDEMCDPADPFSPCSEAPLFIESATVDISRNFGEVTCAIPVCLVNGTILKRYVWCGHVCGGISIFSLYMHKPQIAQNFPCQQQTSFWCMELVPGAIDSQQDVLQADMVWAGTNTGEILAFSLLEQKRQRPFLSLKTGAAVISLCYALDRVYAGLEDGLVIIYERDTKGYWSMLSPIRVGENAVVKMVSLPDGPVLIACEDVLFKVKPLDHGFSRDPLPMEGEENIQDFVVGGQAAWVAFQNSLVLRLVHLKTCKLLQTIDLCPTINVVDDEGQRDFEDSVTCLTMTKRHLLVGTRARYLCKIPLQQTLPFPSGPCSVSYHKHHGAVRFIVAFQNMVERLVRSVDEEEEMEDEEFDEEEELEDEEEEEELSVGKMSRAEFQRKPSVDISPTRRLSLTPLKSKWLSNPNLLLSLKALNEEEEITQFENLMVDIDLDAPPEGNVPSRKSSRATSDPPKVRRVSQHYTVPPESDGKMWLEDNLIVTAGFGYTDLKGRVTDEREGEPCLNCWCE